MRAAAGAAWRVQVTVNIGKGDQRKPEFLEVNPLGKLPAMQVGGAGSVGWWVRSHRHQVQAAAAVALPYLPSLSSLHPRYPPPAAAAAGGRVLPA